MSDVKKFLLGAILVGGLSGGMSSCSNNERETDDERKPKTEQTANQDNYDNAALFENSRSDIKFALACVENFYPYVYFCGEAWTTGFGTTVLYKPDGTYCRVTENTPVPTLEEADKYMGRYLTFEILPDVKSCITVPMDKNTLLAACVLRYCIGGKNFKKSEFVKQLNSGKTGAELAKTLTGWRKQSGVLNRCYFFAALMCGKITFDDLLNLRAEGCYNLKLQDIVVYRNGCPKVDANGFCEWDFSKISQNLETAKKPRTVILKLKGGKRKVQCELVKNIVPSYIWQDVSNRGKNSVSEPKNDTSSNTIIDFAVAAGATIGAVGYAASRYHRKQR